MLGLIDNKQLDATALKAQEDGKLRKKQKPSLFDIIRMLGGFFFFSLSCLGITLFSPLRFLTNPLHKYLGLNLRYTPFAWCNWMASKSILGAMGIFWKCTSDKSGNLPQAIYMYNHGSNIDTLCIHGYIGFVRQLYKKSLENFFLFRWLLKSSGFVPIVRENKELAIAALNEALTGKLKAGHSVCLSPEGTRSMTGELMPFKKGGFHVAVNTKVPVVPVILSGSYDLWPPSLLFASVGNIKIELLEPIYPKEGQTVDEFLAEVEAVFKAAPRQKVSPPGLLNYLVPLSIAVGGVAITASFVSKLIW